MLLKEALNVNPKDMVVLVGAGGKTTILQLLAKELAVSGLNAALSTTTKIYPFAGREYHLVIHEDLIKIHETVKSLSKKKILVLGKQINVEGKLLGLTTRECDMIQGWPEIDVLLLEGDGAKGKSFKAPRTGEPVIPGLATLVIPVIGADCIDQPLTENYFHSIDQICHLTGLRYGQIATVEALAAIFLNSHGYRKAVPPNARWIPFINKVDNQEYLEKAQRLAEILKNAGTEIVLSGALLSQNVQKGRFSYL